MCFTIQHTDSHEKSPRILKSLLCLGHVPCIAKTSFALTTLLFATNCTKVFETFTPESAVNVNKLLSPKAPPGKFSVERDRLPVTWGGRPLTVSVTGPFTPTCRTTSNGTWTVPWPPLGLVHPDRSTEEGPAISNPDTTAM